MLSPIEAIWASCTSLTFPRRVEHEHARAGHAVKGLGHGAAGVAGGGHQDGQRRPVGEVVQQPRLHAGTDVFEGQGRAMKELQRPDAVGHLDQGHREIQRLAHQRLELGRRNLVPQQVSADASGDLDDARTRSASTAPAGSGSKRSGM